MRIYILLGGFSALVPDGYATSAGMYGLASRIKDDLGLQPQIYPWGRYRAAADDMLLANKRGEKVCVPAFSGGASRVTWIGDAVINLAVLYDPSPAWQMRVMGHNFRKIISYENTTPNFLVYGGGIARSLDPSILERVTISQWHPLVQFNKALHEKTIAAIKTVSDH